MVIWCKASGRPVALDGLVQVGELQRIAEEEYRGVVAHQVPVALFGVHLHGETADVTLGVGSAALTGDRGKARKQLGFLANFRKHLGTGVGRDVSSDSEGAKSTRALGVHATLWNHFTVKMRQLFQVPQILQQHGATRAGSQRVLVVGYRCAGCGGKAVHRKLPCAGGQTRGLRKEAVRLALCVLNLIECLYF